MEQITVYPSNEEQLDIIKAFLKALNIPFGHKKTSSQEEGTEIINSIEQSFKELNEVKSGNLKPTPIEELLDEL